MLRQSNHKVSRKKELSWIEHRLSNLEKISLAQVRKISLLRKMTSSVANTYIGRVSFLALPSELRDVIYNEVWKLNSFLIFKFSGINIALRVQHRHSPLHSLGK